MLSNVVIRVPNRVHLPVFWSAALSTFSMFAVTLAVVGQPAPSHAQTTAAAGSVGSASPSAAPVTVPGETVASATTAAGALLAAKNGPKAERRGLFLQVAEKWQGTKEGAEASWKVAYFDLIGKDFAASEARFRKVASDSAAEPAIAGEALLQTGYLPISAFWASTGTETEKVALLQEAFGRLSGIASGGTGSVGATVRSYAANGCGEICLLRGKPVQAEKWYRQAIASAKEAEPTATTIAMYGLGIALYRQGRYGEALEAQTEVSKNGKTGLMLRGLLVSPALPAKASLWRAASLTRLGQKQAAMTAIDDSLRLRELLTADAGGGRLVANAEKSRARLGTEVQVALEREKLLEQAKQIAADTQELPLKSLVSTTDSKDAAEAAKSTKSADSAGTADTADTADTKGKAATRTVTTPASGTGSLKGATR